MARILITSAIPYINGIKHLGNLVGSQLPADLFARYNRARGHEVMFICATDEHGTPAELAAAKAGKPVAESLWPVEQFAQPPPDPTLCQGPVRLWPNPRSDGKDDLFH
jgi:methionyl-tRNA synthetase